MIATNDAVIKVYDSSATDWKVDLRIKGIATADSFAGGDIDTLIAKIDADTNYTATKIRKDLMTLPIMRVDELLVMWDTECRRSECSLYGCDY